MMNWSQLANNWLLDLQSKKSSKQTLEVQLYTATQKKDSLLDKANLLERSKLALDLARPLLSANSIKQLESLANSALSTIFQMEGEIVFDVVSKRFVLRQGDKECDLAEANGGGLVTAISFIFDLFLLLKSGNRRLLVYDEAFYAVSEQYYDAFITFIKQSCKDLNIDLLIVSHDSRLQPSMVDVAYRVQDGKAYKI